jgi:hypothetical protein
MSKTQDASKNDGIGPDDYTSRQKIRARCPWYRVVQIYVAALCLVIVSGCSRPKQVVSSDPVCLDFTVEQMMGASRAVLDDMHFNLEKDDPQSFYLRTRPLAGAQYFQFWRKDNADAYTAARSNVQSLRRIVELEFYPGEGSTCMACRVSVQKLSIPEKPIAGMAGMSATFTTSNSSRQSMAVDEEQLERMEWIDEGPDRALEQKILRNIKRELVKGIHQ